MSVPNSPQHIQGLAALRAFAAIAVLAFHTRLPGFSGGFLGVDVFFTLSGYLTASIALSGRLSVREFMRRRLYRLWPLMIVATVSISAFWVVLTGAIPEGWLTGILFSLDLEMVGTGPNGPLTHFWTLGIEMKFYIIVALLAASLKAPNFLWTMLAGFAAVTTARLWFSDQWLVGFYGVAFHSSGLFLGAAAAAMAKARGDRKVLSISILVVAAVMTIASFQTTSVLRLWITVTEVATCIAILQFVNLPTLSGIDAPAVRLMGTLSYGIYVWHYPIALTTRSMFEPFVSFAITLSLASCLAMISYCVVEVPFQRIARRQLTVAA